jgi:hypothetical protein
MRCQRKVQFSKLLGFSTVADRSGELDFRDPTIDARLGAKLGTKQGKIQFSKLLGFSTLGDRSDAVDFRDPTIDARLGAKVGLKPPVTFVDGSAGRL